MRGRDRLGAARAARAARSDAGGSWRAGRTGAAIMVCDPVAMAASVLERVRGGGLVGPDDSVLALVSGGRDSVCLLDVLALRSAAPTALPRCTSTTGCVTRSPTPTSARARAVRSARRALRRSIARRRAAASRQPAGLGARRGATRAGARALRRRADRHRPHGVRPGRDGALPARRLARASRAARNGSARGPPRAPAAGADP